MKKWKYTTKAIEVDITDCDNGDEVYKPYSRVYASGVLKIVDYGKKITVKKATREQQCVSLNAYSLSEKTHQVTDYYLGDEHITQATDCYCTYRSFLGRNRHPVTKLTITRRPTMANKLLAALKLNKTQRTLVKAGVYDSNGNLTEDGKELVLNYLAGENESKLVELTKDIVEKSKNK